MSDYDVKLTARHSFYRTKETPKQPLQIHCKSDVNLSNSPKNNASIADYTNNTHQCCGEYYKKYEHDEIPVKDHGSYTIVRATGDNDMASLTSSQLEKLEKQVFQDIPSDMQADQSKNSINGLDPSIQFFKSTVEQIFASFYESMQDFDLYKAKFNDILNKNRESTVNEMDGFIKEIIQHIMSSDSSATSSCKTEINESVLDHKYEKNGTSTESEVTPSSSSYKPLPETPSLVEDYKNKNYASDTTEDSNLKVKRNKRDIFNIYLLSTTPLVEIMMNNRNLVSEVNIHEPHMSREVKIASAENLKKLAAKRCELEKYVQQQREKYVPDRDIPVKVSSAKKNIHLNEDFICRNCDENKSIMSKICSYICKRFRKNTLT